MRPPLVFSAQIGAAIELWGTWGARAGNSETVVVGKTHIGTREAWECTIGGSLVEQRTVIENWELVCSSFEANWVVLVAETEN